MARPHQFTGAGVERQTELLTTSDSRVEHRQAVSGGVTAIRVREIDDRVVLGNERGTNRGSENREHPCHTRRGGSDVAKIANLPSLDRFQARADREMSVARSELHSSLSGFVDPSDAFLLRSNFHCELRVAAVGPRTGVSTGGVR
jgi:hypothetical protein